MRIIASVSLALLLSGGLVRGGTPPAAARPAIHQTAPTETLAEYGRLPLSFEPNQGQTDGSVKFVANGKGYSLFLTPHEMVVALERPGASTGAQAGAGWSAVRLRFSGASGSAEITGQDELPGKANYFIGNNSDLWRTDVPTYARVRYAGIYPGVDAVFYGRQGKLEYDFSVAPGVNLHNVRFTVSGASAVRLNRAGDLVISTPAGDVTLQRPVAYQTKGAVERALRAGYVRLGRREFGFAVPGYVRSNPLVIDPTLIYSTYLGGSGGDVAYGVGVDSSGAVYVAGVTNSTNFPTSGAYQAASNGNGDAFISKLKADGTGLIYSTYLGGNGADSAAGLAVDSLGDVFVTGSTTSSNFPVTPTKSGLSATEAFQTAYGGNGDAFVTELSSSGSKLIYSSFLGGSSADYGQAITVDSSGNAYVTGSTQSPDFPTVGPFQPTLGGSSDAFVTKVNFSGTELVYSTFLGGSQADTGQGIRVDSSGNAYVAGYTFSTDFPTQGPMQGANEGDADAFVTELNSTGSALTFSTYLGGSGRDRAFGLTLDSSGAIYVIGDTQSSDYPTTSGAFQVIYGGNGDAFLTKLNAGGTGLTYSTFIGGSGVDQGNGVAVDSKGDAAVVGFTQSSDFPAVNPFQAVLGLTGGSSCGASPCADAFVGIFNPTGNQATYLSYLGGSGADFGQAIALDSSGDAYVAGSSSSDNFPAVATAYQGQLAGVAGNAFVTKVDAADSAAIAIDPPKLNFGNETVSVRSPVQTVTVANVGSSPLVISSITPPTSDFSETDNCVGSVAPRGGTCTINITFTPSSVATETDQFSIADNAPGSPQIITVSGTGVTAATAVTVAPTTLSFPDTNVSSVSAAQNVTITNTGTSTLNITKINVTGDFTETDTCAALFYTLGVGQSCSVSVVFAPTASGARTGTLTIYDNASGSPQGVTLSGNGLALFSVSSPNPTISTIIGSTSAMFSVTAADFHGFTGSISLSCSATVTCTFSPTSIFGGQTSTLTVSSLTAPQTNSLTFSLVGTSGSQTASTNLTVLFESFSLSASPALNTVVAGTPANYTVLVNPANGFNEAITLSCSNLPVGASCTFNPASPKTNGSSPASVALTVATTQSSMLLKPGPGPWWPRGILWMLAGAWVLAGILMLLLRRLPPTHPLRAAAFGSARRAMAISVILALLLLLGSCRGINTATAPTATGNYIITITGTLNSNSSITKTTTVDLAVT
jgi:Beta-propeller repeat/Cep192 domain 4/HYDIN/CFA65/VesB-like, Ig-like domain